MNLEERTVHYCNAVIDPLVCCPIGAHQRQPMLEGYNHPECECPDWWKQAYPNAAVYLETKQASKQSNSIAKENNE